MEVVVHNKYGLEMAIRAFRKGSQKNGTVQEARRRKQHEKPSRKAKRKAEENLARKKRSRKGEFSF